MAVHRYWRINVSAVIDSSNYFAVSNLEFRESAGGADACDVADKDFRAYNEVGNYTSNSSAARDAFNDNTSDWQYVSASGLPKWLMWDFGAGTEKDIIEVFIELDGENYSNVDQAPKDFTFEYSDDNSSWTVAKAVSGELPWSGGEARTFTFSASPSGTTTLTIQHSISYITGASVLAVRHLSQNYGKSSLVIQHSRITQTGLSALFIRHLPHLTGLSSVIIRHTPTAPTGATVLNLRHQITGTGPTALTLAHRPNEAALGSHWAAIITLNGADVSSAIIGSIEVEAEAGTARLANFVMKPTAGAINSHAWVKKPVTIDYLTYSAGVLQTQHRRFTGFVSEAIYDPVTRLTTFECSDLLQESFEGVDRSFIDSIIGGYYSESIFNETESGWEYAQQRLESQEYYYDKNAQGAGRKWHKTAAAANETYTESNIISDTLTLSLATSRDVINTVEIEFNYRLPRKWQREISIGWAFPQSFTEWLGQAQIRMPNKSMFISALGSSWWVKSVSFSETPPSGKVGDTNWINHPEYELILGANATVATRWNQDITEKYALTVKSAASISAFGEIKETARYSVDANEEESHEEEMKDRAAAVIADGTSSAKAASDDYKEPESGSINMGNGDYYLDGTSRADFENDIQTAIALARVDILDSHHRNEVGFDAVLNPLLDIGLSIQVTSSEVTGLGVLTALKETMNIDTGAAISTIVTSIYAPNVSGQNNDDIETPEQADVTPPPAQPIVDIQNHVGGAKTQRDLSGGINLISYAKEEADETWRGFLTNYTATLGAPYDTKFYPFEFRIEMPEVEATHRDSQEFTIDSAIAVAIPEETLIINV